MDISSINIGKRMLQGVISSLCGLKPIFSFYYGPIQIYLFVMFTHYKKFCHCGEAFKGPQSNSEYLVRNPVQAALPSNKRQKAKKKFKYFWLGMTLRPEGSRNLF